MKKFYEEHTLVRKNEKKNELCSSFSSSFSEAHVSSAEERS
jgi:hypothetical protein